MSLGLTSSSPQPTQPDTPSPVGPADMSTRGDAQFVVVANRLPVDRTTEDDGSQGWTASPGGLVTALIPVMKEQGGTWVGWAGSADEDIEPFTFDGFGVQPVPLSSQEVAEYYEGMSNATFWPLYHDCVAHPEYHREWWESYMRVNERFANAAAEVAAPGATVWVQDYQLQNVPELLREMRPDLRIGFFLHIPFPPPELFRQLPWRAQVVQGLLGADLVGFQDAGSAQNFAGLSRLITSGRPRRGEIYLPDGRTVIARDYPISIDAQEMLDLSRTPQVREAAAQLRRDLGDPDHIFLGVDRLDYTKGLRHRVRAFGELFTSGQLDPERNVYLQVATPTRENVEQYKELRSQLDEMVGRINSSVGRIGRSAIEYRHSSYPKTALAAMYRAADVAVITPLRDGMNLVAKEYIAAHDSDDGSLVLSEFAGAAIQLKQAYLVNPYDLNGMKNQLLRASGDDHANHARRMRAMRKHVFRHDINEWAANFLRDLGVPTQLL
ncbi:Trehalose-phosphate synthase [Propionibacterium australiense]|uniref:Glycosyltransferase family 20 n=2 Tax=Propionibacterium australiense TaxID=119981 RepID=A0A383S9V3_9ACTN|nr:Glycosyltransferase family 20 [Propionibacterium australiense]VEH90084.1 Trehalose-phosphate synthase [Propionibacterium australiense]